MVLLCACLAASNSTEKTLGTNTEVANRIVLIFVKSSSVVFAANANSASPRQTELTLVSYLDTFKKCCRNAERILYIDLRIPMTWMPCCCKSCMVKRQLRTVWLQCTLQCPAKIRKAAQLAWSFCLKKAVISIDLTSLTSLIKWPCHQHGSIGARTHCANAQNLNMFWQLLSPSWKARSGLRIVGKHLLADFKAVRSWRWQDSHPLLK